MSNLKEALELAREWFGMTHILIPGLTPRQHFRKVAKFARENFNVVAENLLTLHENTRWISVGERPPKIDEQIICNNLDVARRLNEDGKDVVYVSGYEDMSINEFKERFTHFLPIPPLPASPEKAKK